jgi:hypothetical protein
VIRRRRLPLLIVAGMLAGLAAGAAAAVAAAPQRTTLPWATVNVCDSDGHPDGFGIRASMPGTGDRRDSLHVRLHVQYLRSDGRWRRLGRTADTGWLALGHGDVRARQAGRTFTFTPPAAGAPAYVLRGVATFEWRRGGEAVRRTRRVTEAGHRRTSGADPAGYSAATCAIR